MADIKVINGVPEDTREISCTSSGSDAPLMPRERSRLLVTFVVVLGLMFVWGVALLPAIFYANKLPAPPEPHINTSIMPKPMYPCNKPLVYNDKAKMCVPPCPWVFFSPSEDYALEVVDNFAIAVSLLSFVIILATWLRIKQLRLFPHIIPLYIQGLSAAIAFLIAVANGMGREKAFCTSRFFSEAHENPTTFCRAQGILIHYFTIALALWFLVYSINLVQMMYSDSVVSVQGHQYRVKHIVCSLICWLLPCIPVGVVLGSKTTKYDVMNMRNCFPGGTDTGFFTTTFLTEIAQGVGCTCLFLVAYKLFMFRDTTAITGEQSEKRKKKMTTVVKRLVILMCAYALIFCLTYAPICALQQHSKLLDYNIKQYFGCLVFSPPEQCQKTYEKYTFSATIIVSTLSTALFALTTVCFLAFNKQSRKLWIFWWSRLKICCSCD